MWVNMNPRFDNNVSISSKKYINTPKDTPSVK